LKLLAEGRVNFVSEAIYQPDSRVENIVKAVICSISARSKVEMISSSIRKPKNRKGRTIPAVSEDECPDNSSQKIADELGIKPFDTAASRNQ
jgi:hypothetical protein